MSQARHPILHHPILHRVRTALTDTERAPSQNRHRRRPVHEGLVDLFVERAEDHRASVHRCPPEQVAETVEELVGGRDAVVPDEFPWRVPHAVQAYAGTGPARVAAVATTATLGVATTGAVVLTHGDGHGRGRRALPRDADLYVCVLRTDQVMPGVPEAIAALDPRWPQLWISGPRDGDVELDRLHGLHGPGALHVLLVV